MLRTFREPGEDSRVWDGLLALLLVLAAYLRLRDLDRTSLWYDEAVSWHQSNGSLTALLEQVAQDNYPPLHNMVLWLAIPVLGDWETALRFPSVLFGTLAVWLVYLLGKMLGDKPVGLLSAALLALSPFHIWYSTEARMYALLAACGLAFLLFILKVLKQPTGFLLAGAGLTGALFLYSHVYALLGFASVGLACAVMVLFDLRWQERLKNSHAFAACLAMTASTLAFLPWLIILAIRAQSVAEDGFWIAYPDVPFLRNMVFGISGSLVLFWILLGFATLKTGFALALPASDTHARWTKRAVLVCIVYTAGPILLAYLYSVAVQPILFDRYLIAAWPGLLLLASLGARCLLPVIAPVTVFAAALYLTFPELRFTLLHKVRPEWRQIAADYEARRGSQDTLILYKGFAAPALSYYLRGRNMFEAVERIEDLDRKDPDTGSIWLLLAHTSDEEANTALNLFQIQPTPPESRRFGWGASGLSLYKRSDPD